MPDFSPTFIKVDPATGLTFYDFDGHLRARGLDLSSSPASTADGDSALQWKDTDGTNEQTALVYARKIYTPPFPGVAAKTERGIRIQVKSSYNETSPSGDLWIDGYDNGDTVSRYKEWQVNVAQQSRTLLDSDGKSDWVQGILLRGKMSDVGDATIVPTTTQLYTFTVTHNIGVANTPVATLVNRNSINPSYFTGAVYLCQWEIANVTANSFNIEFYHPSSAGRIAIAFNYHILSN